MGKRHLLANETHPDEQPECFTAWVLQVIPFVWRWDSVLSWVSFLEQDSSSLRWTFRLLSCGEMNPAVLVSVVLAAQITVVNWIFCWLFIMKHSQLPWLYYKNYPKENLSCENCSTNLHMDLATGQGEAADLACHVFDFNLCNIQIGESYSVVHALLFPPLQYRKY